MGAVKPGTALRLSNCINETVPGLGLLLYICCSNSEWQETNICRTIKTHRRLEQREEDQFAYVNTKFAAEFTFCCV